MTTHRSLNKLEFKAHMSIHNFTEVGESEAPGSRYTRDRFGRKHSLIEVHDVARGRDLGKLALLLIFFQILSHSPFVFAEEPEHKSVHIQVSSSDPDLYSLDKKLNPADEKMVFYQDESHTVGFNDDGDPTATTKF